MSTNIQAEIERLKFNLVREKNKPEPERDLGRIASLQSEISEAEQALKEEKAAQNRTVAEGPASPEDKKNAQIEAAVISSEAFLKKEEVVQVKRTANGLRDETGNTVVTSADIDTMRQNSQMIVNDPVNQDEHRQRQEAARDLKTQLSNPDLSEAERTAKQAQHATVIEAIGSFKEAEIVVRQVAVLEEIVSRKPSASLQDSVAEVEARQAQKLLQAREGIKALDALERGTISEETYLKKMDVIAVMDTMTREEFDKKMQDISPRVEPVVATSQPEIGQAKSNHLEPPQFSKRDQVVLSKTVDTLAASGASAAVDVVPASNRAIAPTSTPAPGQGQVAARQ